jgi:hypothetical protein
MPISFDSPCHQDWSTFTSVSGASAERRHCQSCDKTVVDMTRLTRRAAERMVIEAGGKMCGRLRVDPSGAPVYRREIERAPGLLGIAAASLLAACGSTTEDGPVAVHGEVPSAGGDHLLADGAPSSGSLAAPMMPLADDRDLVVTAVDERPGTTIAAIVTEEDDEAVVPTEDQRLLTEAKDGEDHPRGTARRRRGADTTPVTTVTPHGRRNNGGGHVVTAPITGPGPAINNPPETVMMGGISYTP